MSRSEAVHQPEILVSPSIAQAEAVESQVEAGLNTPVPGSDYIWYDCSGDTLE